MIEIITEEVKMPISKERRFQYNPKDLNGKKWTVSDTDHNKIIYTGNFQDSALRCHNLNKKYYRDIATNHNN